MLPDENTAADDWLARFVTCLDAEGHLPPRRGERLDVVTPTGILTGLTLERSAFRFLGLTTRCIAAVALTPDRCVWLGRRSHRKRINPGLWDTLARGSPNPVSGLRRSLSCTIPVGRFPRAFSAKSPTLTGRKQLTASFPITGTAKSLNLRPSPLKHCRFLPVMNN